MGADPEGPGALGIAAEPGGRLPGAELASALDAAETSGSPDGAVDVPGVAHAESAATRAATSRLRGNAQLRNR